MPGVYQVRETQPAGYLSVGATTGVLNGPGVNGTSVGQIVAGNPDLLTQIEIPLGENMQPIELCGSSASFDRRSSDRRAQRIRLR